MKVLSMSQEYRIFRMFYYVLKAFGDVYFYFRIYTYLDRCGNRCKSVNRKHAYPVSLKCVVLELYFTVGCVSSCIFGVDRVTGQSSAHTDSIYGDILGIWASVCA